MTDNEGKLDVFSDQKKESLLSRREFVRNTVRLAVAGALIPGVVSQLAPAIAPDALGGGGPGPIIRRDPATNAKIPINLDDLAGDAPVVVTAEWNFLPAVIYKVRKDILTASSTKRGLNTGQHAVQHPTEPEHAILVYDGKCKHLGCTIGFDKTLGASKDVSDYNEDGFNDGSVLCPCHLGRYDIYNLAVNVPGTPPPAPLNVIEFDVKAYTNELGESFANVIFGEQKHWQDKALQADGAGRGGEFTFVRPAGWSA